MRRLALAVALFAAGTIAQAQTYYVSRTGSGSTCSVGSPCALSTAMGRTTISSFNPPCGSTIIVQDDGTPYKPSTTDNNHGRLIQGGTSCTLENPITLTAARDARGKPLIPTIDCLSANGDMKYVSGGAGTASAYGDICFGGSTNNGFNAVKGWKIEFIRFINTSTASRYDATDAPIPDLSEPQFNNGEQTIQNVWIFDALDGMPAFAYTTAQGLPLNGRRRFNNNYVMYSGRLGNIRGYGHSFYTQNAVSSEDRRDIWYGNTGLFAFDYGVQIYTQNSKMWYMTWDRHVEAFANHAPGPTLTWPTTLSSMSRYSFTPFTGTGEYGNCGYHDKQWYKGVVKNSVMIGGPFFWTGRGMCDTTITDNIFDTNDFYGVNAIQPLTMTGNIFKNFPANPNQASGVCIPATIGAPCTAVQVDMRQSSGLYPSNTYSMATSTFTHYTPNVEPGWGRVVIINNQVSPPATVNVNLLNTAAPGAEPNGMTGSSADTFLLGKPYKIYYWLNYDPAGGAPTITTGTCSVSPCTITLNTAAPGASYIKQPGMTSDGVTAFPKPSDFAPRNIGFFVVPDYDNFGATPTPTSTFTPTPTFTNTPTATFTNTPTPTFTPSPTATGTRTNTPTNTATPSNTPTNTPTPTRTPTATPSAQTGPGYIEAESGACVVTSPGSLVADADAIGGYAFTSDTGDTAGPPFTDGGNILCTVTVPVGQAGRWDIWARVKTLNGSSDSGYVSVNGVSISNTDATGHIWDMGENRACPADDATETYTSYWNSGFVWVKINDRGGAYNCKGSGTTPGYPAAVSAGGLTGYTLVEGANTIQIWSRQPNFEIDRFYVTRTGEDPDSIVPTPTPTPGTGYRHKHRCGGKVQYHSHNGGNIPHVHRPCPW